MQRALKTIAALACLFLPAATSAQSTEVSVSVALDVVDGCVITNAPLRIDFGQYQRVSSEFEQARSFVGLVALCNVEYTNATIELDGGLSANAGVRRMRNSAVPPGTEGEFIEYRLIDGFRRRPDFFEISVPHPFNGLTFAPTSSPSVTAQTIISATIEGIELINGVAGHYEDVVGLKITY